MRKIIRVFCNAVDFDDVLLDTIKPIIETGDHDGVYVTRHWKQGGHWRLHVERGSASVDELASALGDALPPHISDPPRAREFADDSSLAVQKRRAELENEVGPFLPVRPPGTVDVIDEPDRHSQQGGAEGARWIAAFYESTNPHALDSIGLVRAGTSRQSIALDLMVATAHCLSGVGLERGFVSFRSHADAFLTWWPEATGSRTVWESRSVRYGDAIVQRIQALVERLDAGRRLPRHVERWLDTAEPFFARAGRSLARGEFTVDPPWAAAARAGDDTPDLRSSPFHSRASTVQGRVDKVWFAQYRLALNYLYLHLTRIGLAPYDRFLLCHLVADACENLYATAAHEVLFPQEGEGVRVPDEIESRRTRSS